MMLGLAIIPDRRCGHARRSGNSRVSASHATVALGAGTDFSPAPVRVRPAAVTLPYDALKR